MESYLKTFGYDKEIVVSDWDCFYDPVKEHLLFKLITESKEEIAQRLEESEIRSEAIDAAMVQAKVFK